MFIGIDVVVFFIHQDPVAWIRRKGTGCGFVLALAYKYTIAQTTGHFDFGH